MEDISVCGVEKDFRGWIANGFAKFQDADMTIPQEAVMQFSVGEIHQQGARLGWGNKCKETNTERLGA